MVKRAMGAPVVGAMLVIAAACGSNSAQTAPSPSGSANSSASGVSAAMFQVRQVETQKSGSVSVCRTGGEPTPPVDATINVCTLSTQFIYELPPAVATGADIAATTATQNAIGQVAVSVKLAPMAATALETLTSQIRFQFAPKNQLVFLSQGKIVKVMEIGAPITDGSASFVFGSKAEAEQFLSGLPNASAIASSNPSARASASKSGKKR